MNFAKKNERILSRLNYKIEDVLFGVKYTRERIHLPLFVSCCSGTHLLHIYDGRCFGS